MHVGPGNFDVVAKNLVETNFQGADAGAFAFALFHGSDDLLAVLAEVTKFVEFGMEARADHAGIGGESWGLIGDTAFEGFTNVSELVNFIVQTAKQRAAAGRSWRDEISEDRKLRQGFTKRYQLAWAGLAESDAAGEAFKILNAAKLLADFAADDGLLNKMSNCVEAFFDGVAVNQGPKNPGTQKARAHSGDGDIERGDERGRRVFARVVGKNRGQQFKVAHGNRVEHQRVVLFVVANAIEVAQGFEGYSTAVAGAAVRFGTCFLAGVCKYKPWNPGSI